MSYQSNGSVSTGFPSLYDEGTGTDAADKSLSILSAVTGKEVPKSVSQHKGAMPRRTVFLYLLFISTMLGFTYWQYNNTILGAWVATVITPATVTKTPQANVAATTPAVLSTRVPQAKTDAAIIEKVSEKPPVNIAQNPLPSPATSLSRKAQPSPTSGAITKPGASKDLLATASPNKKTEVKKTSKNPTVAKTEKRSASPTQSAETKQPIRADKQTTAATPRATKPAQRTTVASAQPDPDEKLLEGMLRLMKRERTNEAARVRPVK